MRELSANLLGLPAIEALDVLSKYQDLFEGLGKFDEEHRIRLKPTAVPNAIPTARHVPLPLKAAVVKELNRIEKMGVISKLAEFKNTYHFSNAHW